MFSFYFQDANGPSSEMLLTFSDCTLLLILPIGTGIFFYILSLICRYPTFRFLTEHQPLEFTWTFLPALSLILLALPSLSLLYTLDEVGFPCSTSKVQGHQWYWVYESSDISNIYCDSYLSSGAVRLLSSDGSLTLSNQVTLRFLITAADVLHSWTVPSFGLNADAVPGRLNSLSVYLERSGIFYGQCSEICGSNHSFMPIQVEVTT